MPSRKSPKTKSTEPLWETRAAMCRASKATRRSRDLICQAIEVAGYTSGKDIWLALDPAASELAKETRKRGREGYCFFKSDPERIVTNNEMIDLWSAWADKYPIRSIEDGLPENDGAGWT